jgi:hypothetical protein
MAEQTLSVDEALPAVRALFAEAGVAFRLVGGIAVVHHGYARMTEDIDVLVAAEGPAALDPLLAPHGFTRESRTRLRHVPTGVRVDLLVAGDPGPRAGDAPYPDPSTVTSSPHDAAVAGLAPLLELKLRAHRYQDLADVVALLKRMEDSRYIELESQVVRELRPKLGELRRDALEELALG